MPQGRTVKSGGGGGGEGGGGGGGGGAKGVGSGGGDGSALPPSFLLVMIQDRGRVGAFRGFPLRKKNRITNPPRYFLSI